MVRILREHRIENQMSQSLATLRPASRFHGRITAPGDKSISHRALLFAALGDDRCRVENLAPGEDVQSTIRCLEGLGVRIDREGRDAVVHGVGLGGLAAPPAALDCGNSGTTMRLLAGMLAGAGIGGILDGDESLRARPMRRVLEPLRRMGAVVRGTTREGREDEYAPLRFETLDAKLRGSSHRLPVASAQVKTAILLAGLWADEEVRVAEPAPSRDHTERMLGAFGADFEARADGELSLRPQIAPLRLPSAVRIPGDPSSAAFLIAGAILSPRGWVEVIDTGLNPGRLGWVTVLQRMGADVQAIPAGEAAGEPVGILQARSGARLLGTEIRPKEIPSLVDEVPLLAVIATQALGRTVIHGASELRVKESDRLAEIARGLRAMGARIDERDDGLVIEGPTPLRGASVDAGGDHRIAMSLAMAALIAEGETRLAGARWTDVSFPGFFEVLARLTA